MSILAESQKAYTYKDYSKLPEGAPYQLIKGRLVMTPSPTIYHQKIIGRIHLVLAQYVYANQLGEVILSPVDVYFSETETYQPDIIFVSANQLSIIGEERVSGAPDLIIEVLSPSTAYYDLRHKMNIYEEFGVIEYWIVDPMDQTLDIFQRNDGVFHLRKKYTQSEVIDSPLIHGLTMNLGDVFNC